MDELSNVELAEQLFAFQVVANNNAAVVALVVVVGFARCLQCVPFGAKSADCFVKGDVRPQNRPKEPELQFGKIESGRQAVENHADNECSVESFVRKILVEHEKIVAIVEE